jgi:hypothetical protein
VSFGERRANLGKEHRRESLQETGEDVIGGSRSCDDDDDRGTSYGMHGKRIWQ